MNMVPAPAMLVVGHDDDAIFPERTVLHRMHDIGHMLLAAEQVGVPRMFVVRTQRLDEAYSRQVAVVQVGEEILFVLQVSSFGGGAISIVSVESEHLMMGYSASGCNSPGLLDRPSDLHVCRIPR